jgi:hypothetical protein
MQVLKDGKPVDPESLMEHPLKGVSIGPDPESEPGDAPVSEDAAAPDQPEPPTPAETPAAPELVDLTLGGKPVKVAKDVADAYRAEINRRDGIRGNELQKLRERLAHLEGKAAATPAPETKPQDPELPKKPDPSLQISDPDTYAALLETYLDAKTERRINAEKEQLRQEQRVAEEREAREKEWAGYVSKFYEDNPELVAAKDVVDTVYARIFPKIENMLVEDGLKELAAASYARLAELGNMGKAPSAKQKPIAVEGSRVKASEVAAAKPEDTGPRSLTQALKQRAADRSAAFNKGPTQAPGVRKRA